MKIGLLDIDSHAKVKKWGATIYPNLALCKIAAYHKQRGDDVEWASQMEHYDILYRSKVFTFTPDDNNIYSADKVVRGGTGYEMENRLMQPIRMHSRIVTYTIKTRYLSGKRIWQVGATSE